MAEHNSWTEDYHHRAERDDDSQNFVIKDDRS